MGENIDRQATLQPLVAALEHIAVKGNLLLFAPDRAHRMEIRQLARARHLSRLVRESSAAGSTKVPIAG